LTDANPRAELRRSPADRRGEELMSNAFSEGERWCRLHLPRLYDLYGRSDKTHRDNYFTRILPNYHFEVWQKSFKAREEVLQRLDSGAWEQLIKKALPLVTTRDSRRGWYQLINHLDEARGWVLLKDRGFKKVDFVQNQNVKTPDLFATNENAAAIIEVKSPLRAYDVQHGLTDRQKQRILRSIREAREQLETYQYGASEKIALLVVRFDSDHQFVGQNYEELGQLISSQRILGIEIVHQIAL
jgi:hypothetical protein